MVNRDVQVCSLSERRVQRSTVRYNGDPGVDGDDDDDDDEDDVDDVGDRSRAKGLSSNGFR